jgi:Domain of unknown function (DUF4331)
MLNKNRWAVATVALAAVLATSAIVSASHHFESALSQAGPAFDHTDVYVFPSERTGYTVFIANVNPNVEPGGESPFDDKGLYSIHIGRDQALSNGMTLTFQFTGSKGRVGLVGGANEGVGSRGPMIGEVNIGHSAVIGKGLKVWVGAIRDPFMGNCVGLARQHVSEASGKFNPNAYDNKVDFFEQRTTGSIVVEVPNSMLGQSVYLYATTAKRSVDDWIQINRMANPLLTHMFMHFDAQNTLEHVAHRPDSDSMRSSAISGHVLRMVTMAGTHKDNAVPYTDKVVKRLLPDLIGYTVGKPAHYSAGSLGGRSLADDVMDSQISLFWGKTMTDGSNYNADRRQKSFPYIIPLSTLSGGKPPKWDERPGCAP